MLDILLLAVAVSMDATAVAAAFAIRGASGSVLLQLAVTFGAFQLLMSLTGALGGEFVTHYMSALDHWIAFVLLAYVGGRMVHEAFEESDEEPASSIPLSQLLMLGVATSIDALAVGVSLPAMQVGSLAACTTIGVATFSLSLAGAHVGKRVGERFGMTVEVMGGLILIGLGVKTLLEHTLGA